EGKVGEGYNAVTNEYGDLVAQGVIDPVKVTRSALVNATSIAGMLLTTETLVVEKPEQEEAPAAGHGHGPTAESAQIVPRSAPTRRISGGDLRRLGVQDRDHPLQHATGGLEVL